MKGSKKLKRWLQDQGIDAKILPTGQETASVDDSSKVLDINKEDIVKSVVFQSSEGPLVCIVQGSKRVSEEKLKEIMNASWVKLADPEEVKEVTGYAVGGVPPVGHEKEASITYVLDENALEKEWVYAGGGDATSQLKIRVDDIQRLLSPLVGEVGEET